MPRAAPFTKYTLAFAVVVIAIAAGALLKPAIRRALHGAAETGNAAAPDQSATTVTDAPAPRPADLSGAGDAFVKPLPECARAYGLANSGAIRRPHQVTRTLDEKLGSPIASRVLWRNIHFVTSSGERRRVRLSSRAGDGSARFDVRLFGVDEENLPVPMGPSETVEADEIEAKANSLINAGGDGHVTLTGSSVERDYRDGTRVSIIESAGEVEQLEIRGPTGKIACAGVECDCL